MLPEYMVDPSPSSLVYMVLYSLVWLFVRMDEVAAGEGGDGGVVAVSFNDVFEFLLSERDLTERPHFLRWRILLSNSRKP